MARALLAAVAISLATTGLGAASEAARADTSMAVSVVRGVGTELLVTVANNGPNPSYSVDNSGNQDVKLIFTLDKGSSASTIGVVAHDAPKPWS